LYAFHVDGIQAVEVFFGRLLDIADVRYAGAVDEDIDWANCVSIRWKASATSVWRLTSRDREIGHA
jgi:hypothetical protein